jgi:hypothetical protein
MKFNLKNRPKPNHSIEDLQKRLEDHSFNVAIWFEGFEKELREQINHLEKQDQDHVVPLGFMVIRLKEILGE